MKEAPKYEIVADHLRQQILEKELAINEQLPQENAIAAAYNVSRITVRKALDILVDENLIYRIQGSGTYVKDNQPHETGAQESSLEIFDFSKFKVKLLNFAVDKPDTDIMDQLNVTEFDFTYEIERLILDEDDEVVAFQKIYMPAKVIQGMRMDVLKGSIYEFLTEDQGLTLGSAIRTLSSEIANSDTIKIMGLNEAEPLLTMEQRSFLNNGQIFEYVYNYIRPSKFSLHESINLTD
ncbi:GntR family transcriptional regulator [Pediococcus ethanolidurans]|uniref:Transcriptional regulator n=1 Tax=Pediococcus ethanolidurans TaxID=319653 RepID=A0A0R2K227_9LACO|nr:GntR family transcriptional regulator [Pediococcus ethanolidurans]KRN83647.1 transcriptional regulator [Pediococcus ethanolidurans]GEN93998.1 mannosyl-D-glycerate transport/metabolism system repressor MngR [Pediococcus ethanolidurans]SER01222.1 GntR family transcriptional regulator, mannosyl-D-glycerate transport/metabolism system repressor [Pediococcus ethanolidurans]